MGNNIQTGRSKELDRLIESSLESDSYYEAKATPIKSASAWKQEHREQICRKFQFEEFSSRIKLGFNLIANKLSPMIGIQAYNHVVQEFVERKAPPKLIEVEPNQRLTMQEEWSISNDTMNHIYQLATKLLEDNHYKDADALFTVLCYLNPKVPEHSLGKCFALYLLEQYDEALELLQFTKILMPQDAAPYVYSALCNQKLGKAANYDEDMMKIYDIFGKSEGEKEKWTPFMQQLTAKQEV